MIPEYYHSSNESETRAFGRKISACLEEGDVVSLEGELGSGKTQIVKGMADGFDLDGDRDVTSPTFTLVNVYDGSSRIYHVDLYRLSGDFEELESCGLFEFMGKDGITIIEWGERARKHLPIGTLRIIITTLYESGRKIIVERI